MRPLIYAGAIILILILGKIFFFSKKDSKDNPSGAKPGGPALPMKPMKVKTIVVTPENTENMVYSSGSTVANDEVEIKSEINGKIIKLILPEGGMVSKGQLIAKIKDDDILAQIHKIEVDEKLAQQTEARQKKLLLINAISQEEYDVSLNKVNSTHADKEILNVQLSRTEIRAPFSGKLGLKNISLGAYVTPSTVITTLVQYNPIKLDFSLPEKYLSNIHKGESIKFMIDGSEEKFSANVIAIDPKIDPNLRTLKVRAVASNAGNRLIPGMFLKVLLNLGNKNSIMVPTETVIPVLDGNEVYIKKNGMTQNVKVDIGLRNASKLQILSGLNVGDSLIVSGLMSMKPGMPVF